MPFRKLARRALTLVFVSGASCSVFPDEAILPPRAVGEAGGADEPDPAIHEVMGGAGADAPLAGAGGGAGGAGQTAGAPALVEPEGGAPSVDAGGSAGQPEARCVNRQVQHVPVNADTWIDAEKPNARHGNDEQLLVVSGTPERRALFALTLPGAPPGSRLQRAAFVLRLEGNGASTGRALALHRLKQAFNEARASWRAYDDGSQWDAFGGDFGPELASAEIPSGTTTGAVLFDVTEPVGSVLGSSSIPLALIVIETSAATAESMPLSFTSLDAGANAAGAPSLRLVYCDL